MAHRDWLGLKAALPPRRRLVLMLLSFVIPEESVRATERGFVAFRPKLVRSGDREEWVAEAITLEIGARQPGNGGQAPRYQRQHARGQEAHQAGDRRDRDRRQQRSAAGEVGEGGTHVRAPRRSG